MITEQSQSVVQRLDIKKEERIKAPIDIVFETLLEQITVLNATNPEKLMPLKLEAWPGGRWYRDLGNGSGHLWGHVQVIIPPRLLEISGPLFMSFPAVSHIQYRLTSEGNDTVLTLIHRAFGEFADHPEVYHAEQGWGHMVQRIRQASEQKVAKQ